MKKLSDMDDNEMLHNITSNRHAKNYFNIRRRKPTPQIPACDC